MDLRRPLIASLLLHIIVIIVVCVGLPSWRMAPTLLAPIPVELVNVGDKTMAPKVNPLPKKGVEKGSKPIDAPKVPAPPPVDAPTPMPAPEPEFEPAVKPEEKPQDPPKPEVIPEPKPQVTPQPKPALKPEVKPEVKPKTQAKKEQDKAKKKDADKKPQKKKENDFESLLKNLDQSVEAEDDDVDKTQPPKPTRQLSGELGDEITQAQQDAVRRQIGQCWNVVDSKGSKNIEIPVRIFLNPDGMVRDAQLINPSQFSSPSDKALAESALRAARDPTCQPLNLPKDKYDSWKSMRIVFDPSKML